jgi:putative ABC transport system ATP-binding protein
MIVLDAITKVYRMGDIAVHALRGVSLAIADGEFVAIMGPSGSGKSTMMNIVGCLDTPSGGSYQLDGIETGGMTDDALATVRNRKIGFVFQSFNLLPRLSALEQVMLPLAYARVPHRKALAAEALESVGLGERMHHKPTELSGGQQQRVAIARALVTRPSMILADEPTGNLDTTVSAEIMALFGRLNAAGITIVFVTHEPDIAAYTNRVLHIRDGLLYSDERRNAAGTWEGTSLAAAIAAAHVADASVVQAGGMDGVAAAGDEAAWKPSRNGTSPDAAPHETVPATGREEGEA